MTRLWNLPTHYLCDDHLLGEHKEIHQEVGTIENHPHGDAIARGHAKVAQVQLSLIDERHDELVEAMQRRGMNHESPLDFEVAPASDIGYVDEHYNLVDLYNRCDDCAERIDNHGGFP